VLSHNHGLNSFDSLLESMRFRNQTPQRVTCPCWHIGVAGILQQVDEIYDTAPSRRCNEAELPRWPRSALMSMVRCRTSRSRTR
jgi:hypothetical protein